MRFLIKRTAHAHMVLHVQIEIEFLAIMRLGPGIVRKIEFFSFECNQDQVFILSGTGDMIENV